LLALDMVSARQPDIGNSRRMNPLNWGILSRTEAFVAQLQSELARCVAAHAVMARELRC
jgi:hypothetical protein